MRDRDFIKRYLLEQAAVVRPALRMKRVSNQAVADSEARLRYMADEMIHRHPCIGRTIKP